MLYLFNTASYLLIHPCKVHIRMFQMLQCILGMVEKTKRAITVLQQRNIQDRDELMSWARKTAEEAEQDVKRRASKKITRTWSGLVV